MFRISWLLRATGALALWTVGIVHLHEYQDGYAEIPTIGTLFLLNFVGATAVALGLLVPLERLFGRRGVVGLVLLSLAGIGQAATAFVFLAISEQRPLFGFQEPGYDPAAIMASRVAEVATVVLLGGFLVTLALMRRTRPRIATSTQDPFRLTVDQ